MFTLKPEERSAALKSTESGVVERKEYDCKFRVDPEVAFVLDDMKPGRANKFVYAYVQNRASDNPEKRVVYLISPLKDADQKAALAEADGLLAALGNPPIAAASALQAKYYYLFPKREYVPRERGVLRFEKPYGRSWRNAWRAATAEQVNDGGTKLYVVIEGRNREPQDAPAASSPRSFDVLIEHMKESGLFGMDTATPVFGLRKNAKLRQEHGWTEFKRYVEKAEARR